MVTASTGYSARCRFGRQHDGVGAVIDRGRHVGRLGPRRRRRLDHRIEHLRRHDGRPAGDAAGGEDALLQRRHRLGRHLHAEIAARHHDAVALLDDLVEMLDGLRLLELGHDGGASRHQLLRARRCRGRAARRTAPPSRRPATGRSRDPCGPSASSATAAGSRLGTFTPLRSLIVPATSTTTSMVLASCATMRSRTLPSSISRRPPGSAALKISGWGRGMRLAVPGAGSRSKRSFWPTVNSIGPLAKAPSRSLGPCRSMRIATGCLNCFSRARSLFDPLAVVVMHAVAEVEAEHVGAGLEQGAQRARCWPMPAPGWRRSW